MGNYSTGDQNTFNPHKNWFVLLTLKNKIGGVEGDATPINLAWDGELLQLFPNTTPKRGALALHILHPHNYELE